MAAFAGKRTFAEGISCTREGGYWAEGHSAKEFTPLCNAAGDTKQVILMHVVPISKLKGSNFRKRYHEWAENPSPNLAQAGRMMAELIEYLEDNVSVPDVRAFTSQTDLVLNDTDTWQTVLVTINALPRLAGPEGYEITYYVEPPWLCVTGYADNVIAASEMIIQALEKAIPSEIRLFR